MSKVYLILCMIILCINSFALDSSKAITIDLQSDGHDSSQSAEADITAEDTLKTQKQSSELLEITRSQQQKRTNIRNLSRSILGLSAMLMAYVSCRAIIDFSNNGHDLESHNKIFLIPYFCISGLTYLAIGCDQLYKIWQNYKQDIKSKHDLITHDINVQKE